MMYMFLIIQSYKTDMFFVFNYSDVKTDMFFFVYEQVSPLRRNEFFKINASVLANVNFKNTRFPYTRFNHSLNFSPKLR